jgi:hypothetical protein
MQEREYATLAKRRRKKCALEFSTSKPIKRVKMDKTLCRVIEVTTLRYIINNIALHNSK